MLNVSDLVFCNFEGKDTTVCVLIVKFATVIVCTNEAWFVAYIFKSFYTIREFDSVSVHFYRT